MQTLHLNEMESNGFEKHCCVTFSVQWCSLDKTWSCTLHLPWFIFIVTRRKEAANMLYKRWMPAPENIVHRTHLKQLFFFIVLSLSSPTLPLLHSVPAELESSHGCRADEGFLPCGGVVQPARWFLPAHPVSRAGRNETQRCPDGLASSLETSPGLLRKEELHR